MEYISNFFRGTAVKKISQETFHVITQDEIREQLRYSQYRKPDAYKSINASQIKIIGRKNPEII